MKRVLFVLVIVSTLMYAGIGKITALSGKVSIKRGGNYITATLNSPIEKKDQIITKQNSRAQIVFKDNTVVSIGEKSNLKVDEYFFDNKPDSRFKVSIAQGAFKFITGKIGKLNKKRFSIKTKTATIGIRGTIGFGKINVNGASTFACTLGAITVKTAGGMVVVPAGQVTEVTSPNAPPKPPKKLTAAQIQNLKKSSGDNTKASATQKSTAQATKKLHLKRLKTIQKIKSKILTILKQKIPLNKELQISKKVKV